MKRVIFLADPKLKFCIRLIMSIGPFDLNQVRFNMCYDLDPAVFNSTMICAHVCCATLVQRMKYVHSEITNGGLQDVPPDSIRIPRPIGPN